MSQSQIEVSLPAGAIRQECEASIAKAEREWKDRTFCPPARIIYRGRLYSWTGLRANDIDHSRWPEVTRSEV